MKGNKMGFRAAKGILSNPKSLPKKEEKAFVKVPKEGKDASEVVVVEKSVEEVSEKLNIETPKTEEETSVPTVPPVKKKEATKKKATKKKANKKATKSKRTGD